MVWPKPIGRGDLHRPWSGRICDEWSTRNAFHYRPERVHPEVRELAIEFHRSSSSPDREEWRFFKLVHEICQRNAEPISCVFGIFDVEADNAVLITEGDNGNAAGHVVFELNNLLRCHGFTFVL